MRVTRDYGIDVYMTTFNDPGEVENGHVLFQLKATDRLTRTADGQSALLRIECSALDRWLRETYPTVLVLYDAATEVAYWLYVQAYFRGPKAPPIRGQTVTVHLPLVNVLNAEAMRGFRAAKASILEQTKGVRHG